MPSRHNENYKQIFDNEVHQLDALALTEGQEIPKEVRSTVLKLRKKNIFYSRALRASFRLSQFYKNKDDQLSLEQKRNMLEVGIMETDSLIQNIKKYAFDPRIKELCLKLVPFISAYSDKNKVVKEFNFNNIEKIKSELSEMVEDQQRLMTQIKQAKVEFQKIQTEYEETSRWKHPFKKRNLSKKHNQKKDQVDRLEREKESKKQKYKYKRAELAQRVVKSLPEEQLLEKWEQTETEISEELNKKEKKRIAELAFAASPNAEMQATLYTLRQYRELALSILTETKEYRQADLKLLHQTTLNFQKLIDPKFREDTYNMIKEETLQILKNQDEFEGLRGVIQKVGTKGLDMMVTGYESLMGDENTKMLQILKVAKALGQNILQPVQYSENLVKKLHKDAMAQIDPIIELAKANKSVIQNMRNAILDLMSRQNEKTDAKGKKVEVPLSREERIKFLKAHDAFVKFSLKFNKQLIRTQSKMASKAYVRMHGTENSMFSADSQGAAKFLDAGQIIKLYESMNKELQQKDDKEQLAEKKAERSDIIKSIKEHAGGINLARLWSYYSPWGIMMPEEVKVNPQLGSKFKPKHAYKHSVYTNSSLKDYPILKYSLAVGSSRTRYLAFRFAGGAGEGLIKKIPGVISKIISKGWGKFIPIIGEVLAIYDGVKIGTAISDEIWGSGAEKRIIKKIAKKSKAFLAKDKKGNLVLKDNAPNFEELCAPELAELRKQVLITEIDKKRKFWQSVGYDLKNYNFTNYDKFVVQDFNDGAVNFPRDSMKKTGALLEAFRNANKRLLYLGLPLFPYPQGLQ